MKIAYQGAIAELSDGERTGLLQRDAAPTEDRAPAVTGIIADVRSRGDAALLEMARMFDGAELERLEVPATEWDAAVSRLPPDLIKALRHSARNIEAFHRALRPELVEVETEPGVRLARHTVALARAGVYAPGGRAAYASSVLMGVVAAQAAGVPEVVVCSPPGADGRVSDTVLAAASVGGATRVFAVGGAGAIAAMAYGTESVPSCDVVVGPGNHWVNEAKRQVAGDVRIDSPAGPSELLVLADADAPPAMIVRELIAQAEHDPDAAVVLVTTSASLLATVEAMLVQAVTECARREIVDASLASNGGLLLATDAAEAADFTNAYAPEHLLVLGRAGDTWLPNLKTAGTIFVGESSSVSFGDYLTGANHVLPTGGRAHAFSGLGTDHFTRSYTVQRVDNRGARSLATPTARFAESEGLPGHAESARALGED